MEVAYKALNKDMTCTKGKGVFTYPVGEWVEEGTANVGRNGLHAALNPLDCIQYYPDLENSVYYLALAAGDISEDGYGSRISCTRLKLVKQLDLKHFVAHSIKFIVEHPHLPCNSHYLCMDSGIASNKFMIIRGKDPIGQGKTGDIIALLKEYPDTDEIEEYAMYVVGDGDIKGNTWYGMQGEVCCF